MVTLMGMGLKPDPSMLCNGMLAGLEPETARGHVYDGYRRTLDYMLTTGLIDKDHNAGDIAHLLRLAALMDTERKAYAIAAISKEASALMERLHESAKAKGDEEYRKLQEWLTK